MSKYIHAKKIILDQGMVHNAYLEITDDNKFGQILDHAPPDSEIIDYSHYVIGPGLVDTHIHGYKSHDVMDNNQQALENISQGLLSCGVTSWLPTTLTDAIENLNVVCQTIGQYYDQVTGAKIRGIFLEGPFFTEKYKGAQNSKYMTDPSIEKLDKWNNLANDLVKKIAIAPERDGAADFIDFAKSMNIHTALGHSKATYDQAKQAVEAGANIFVHAFNGMSSLHHREPGMVGAALTLKDCFAEVICDGHHLHPAAIDIILRSRGVEETVLISDCMRAGGMGDGASKLGEFDVIVRDGQARLKTDGNLAGSILELKDAVKNLLQWELASLEDAVRMASYNPAKSVGIDNICGRIAPTYEADFIVLTEEADLVATYLDGKLVYETK